MSPELLDSRPMGRLQITVVTICIALITVEGYDILAMSFAVSGIVAEYGLSPSQLGVLLSSGLFGMALGSALIAPLADRIGRRWLSIGCLCMTTAGMTLGALAQSSDQLLVSRVIAGLGVGGLVASLPVLIAEYTPRRRRSAIIALYTTGLPLGGVLGGFVSRLVLADHGWRSLFVVGAATTAVMTVLVVFVLPESLSFLAGRRDERSRRHAEAIFSKVGVNPRDVLCGGTTAEQSSWDGNVWQSLFGSRIALRTAAVWAAFFLMMAGFYFASTWTPRLLEESGRSVEQALNGGLLLNLGGVVGTLLFSVLAIRFSSRALTLASFAAMAVSFGIMGVAISTPTAGLLVATVLVGVSMNAAAAGLFTIIPDLYPPQVRATAVGWAIATGRLGAILSPIIVGLVIGAGLTPGATFMAFAGPTVLAAGAVLVATSASTSVGRAEPVSASTGAA